MSNENKPAPTWHMKVTSSNIEEVWYRPVTEQLRVRFKGGSEYVYLEVTLKEFVRFSIAESQGAYLNSNIKGVKPCKKVEG